MNQESLSFVLLKTHIDEFIKDFNYKPNSERVIRIDLNLFLQFIASNSSEVQVLINLPTRQKTQKWLENYSSRASKRRFANIRKFTLWLEKKHDYFIDELWKLKPNLQDKRNFGKSQNIQISQEDLKNVLLNTEYTLDARCALSLLLDSGANLLEILSLEASGIKKGFISLQNNKHKKLVKLSPISEQLLEKFFNYSGGWGSAQDILKTANTITSQIKRIFEKELNISVTIMDLKIYAQEKLKEQSGLETTQLITGRKKLYSLINIKTINSENEDELPEYLQRLKTLHEKAMTF